MTYETREQWLNAYVQAMKPIVEGHGYEWPGKIRVSIGWPSGGRRSKAIGECWANEASADGHNEIFISPILPAVERIAGVLTHEVIHAVVGHEAKHGPKFGKLARLLGLEGKLTATTEGEAWREWAMPIIEGLGPLPYAALTEGSSSAKPKQTTRMIKATCPDCGLTFRLTRKWIEATGGELHCPNPAHEDHVHMAIEGLESEGGDDDA